MDNNTFSLNSIRSVDVYVNQEAIQLQKFKWKQYVKEIKPYPLGKINGQGIVKCAGFVKHLTCAWVNIQILRHLGCDLLIELWHKGGELSAELIENLQAMGIIYGDFFELGKCQLSGFTLKPLAIVNSRFEEIIFLNADNNCVSAQTVLFKSPEYLHKGAIFWPEYWYTADGKPILYIVEYTKYKIPKQESGQILINKRVYWKDLNLRLFFNQNHKIIYGDKDCSSVGVNSKSPKHQALSTIKFKNKMQANVKSKI